jgi:hypothetical protein
MFVGEKPHQCDICKKRFSSTSNLKTHLRLHSGQKPYACDLCPAKFTQFVHLKLHKRLHTNERPYTCQGCSKKYISASGLRCVLLSASYISVTICWCPQLMADVAAKNFCRLILYWRGVGRCPEHKAGHTPLECMEHLPDTILWCSGSDN